MFSCRLKPTRNPWKPGNLWVSWFVKAEKTINRLLCFYTWLSLYALLLCGFIRFLPFPCQCQFFFLLFLLLEQFFLYSHFPEEYVQIHKANDNFLFQQA